MLLNVIKQNHKFLIIALNCAQNGVLFGRGRPCLLGGACPVPLFYESPLRPTWAQFSRNCPPFRSFHCRRRGSCAQKRKNLSEWAFLRIEDDIIWDLANFEKSSLTELLTNEDIEPKKIMIILFLFVNATQEE